MNEKELEGNLTLDYLKWARVDFKKVKLVSLTPKLDIPFLHKSTLEGGIDPRVIYIADSASHCIRRILVKQMNTDTFAGVCGISGFKDGLFGQNLLNKPDMVGVDANGTVYIHDSENKYIRIVDPATKLMRTMIHGSCHLDYLTNVPELRVPF